MAVAEITRRHVTELALTWWRRDTSPVLLHHGVRASYADLDERILTYADGASLDPAEVFNHLSSTMNPTAPDFVSDVVAGLFVLRAQGRLHPYSQAWLKSIPDPQVVAAAYHQLMRWLGCAAQQSPGNWVESLCGARVEEHKAVDPGRVMGDVTGRVSEALQCHRPNELRFIDAWGQVQGHFAQEVGAMNALPASFTSSDLCTYVLFKPEQVLVCLPQAVGRGDDPAAVFLAAGVSGQTSLLPHLLRSASQPEIAVLALDAFRRITGFDALAGQGLTWTHQQHSIKKPKLVAAYQAAQAWLDAHGKSLPDKNSFLGKPSDDMQHLVSVLRYGRQADREVAAMRALGKTVFPVRSKVSVQHMVLDHFFPEVSEAA
jgi:hypothetical protein